ncbi:hypothetical protein [Streptomyces qinzhouensis]|uniref:Uncharacterized protein n=1 Tax=Streptomyces qinzhouensis TaxID=2599401 RepID=A0A5B8IQ73_9ACTN|nr:hypothetical protein [Streptomyces qinzhouensis]QDY79759.1 hypothetical protein FQU76_28135 [Streptomyces qinzhouensis]
MGHDFAHWSPTGSEPWYAARDATAALRDVLVSAGLEKDFPYLQAQMNAFGHGLVELGRVSPETAERLTALLDRALSCEWPGDATCTRQPASNTHTDRGEETPT